VTKLLEDPTTAESLLSQNLPKASNFYLSYFLVQSLLIGSGALAQPFNLFRFHVQRRFLKDPRKQYTRWHRLQIVHWGSVFPVYTNLGVISTSFPPILSNLDLADCLPAALSYALIAPVVLGFAAVGVGFLHGVYRYNLIYVYDSEIDTKGLVYPRALLQMILGLYFAEICMIGLFGLRSAIGPVVLTAILLVITALVHISLIDAVRPFLNSLPKTLTVEEDRQHLLDTEPPNHETSAMGRDQYDRWAEPWLYDPEQEGEEHILGSTRGAADGVRLEGARGAVDTLTDGFKTIVKKKIEKDHPEINAQLGFTAAFFRRWIRPDPAQKSNWLLRWLHPEIYSDYTVLRRLVPEDLPDPKYPEELERDIYFPSSFLGKPPTLWIPRDPGGISRQEVDHTKKVIPVTDEYVSIDEDGRLNIDLDEPRLVFDIDRLRY
jgi:hypothetical protein